MPTKVKVAGVGTISFPDTMSVDDIQTALDARPWETGRPAKTAPVAVPPQAQPAVEEGPRPDETGQEYMLRWRNENPGFARGEPLTPAQRRSMERVYAFNERDHAARQAWDAKVLARRAEEVAKGTRQTMGPMYDDKAMLSWIDQDAMRQRTLDPKEAGSQFGVTAMWQRFSQRFPGIAEKMSPGKVEAQWKRVQEAMWWANEGSSEYAREMRYDRDVALGVPFNLREEVLRVMPAVAAAHPESRSKKGWLDRTFGGAVSGATGLVESGLRATGVMPESEDQARFLHQYRTIRDEATPSPLKEAAWYNPVAAVERVAPIVGEVAVAGPVGRAIGGAAGGVARGIGAGRRAVTAARVIGTGVGGAGAFYPKLKQEGYQALLDEGVDKDTADTYSTGSALIQSAVFALLPPILRQKAIGAGAGRTVMSLVKNVGLRTGETELVMTAASAADRVSSEYAKWVSGVTERPDLKQAVKDVVKSAVMNFLPSLFLSAPGALSRWQGIKDKVAKGETVSRQDGAFVARFVGLSPADLKSEASRTRAVKDNIANVEEKLNVKPVPEATPPDVGGGPRMEAEVPQGPDGGRRARFLGGGQEGGQVPGQEEAKGQGPVEPPPRYGPARFMGVGPQGEQGSPPEAAAEHPGEATAAEKPPGAPPEQPGGTIPPPGMKTTGTKHAKTAELRDVLGLSPRTPETPESVQEWHYQAVDAVTQDPGKADELVGALKDKQLDLATVDTILNRRISELEQARQAGGGDVGKLQDAIIASERLHTAWGRLGVAAQVEYGSDNSLPGLIRRATNKGETRVTADQMRKLEEVAAENEALRQRSAAANERAATAEATLDVVRALADVNAKRRGTIESRFKAQYSTAHEYGIDPEALRSLATEEAAAEAEGVRAYNEGYRYAVEFTGLTRAKIRKIDNRGFFEKGGTKRPLSEYGRLDELAPILKDKFPDFDASGDPQEVLAKLREGPKREPQWYDKLDSVARRMAEEKGKPIPEDVSFRLERQPGEDAFDWETGEFRSAPEPATASGQTPVRSTKAKLADSRKAFSEAVAEFGRVARGKLYANPLDPELLVAAGKVALRAIDLGVKTFADLIVTARDALGDVADRARDTLRAAWNEHRKAGKIPSAIKDPTDAEEVGRFAKSLVRRTVASGITDVNEVIDEIHDELTQHVPEITRQQTIDAIAARGAYRQRTRSELTNEAARIRGEIRKQKTKPTATEAEAKKSAAYTKQLESRLNKTEDRIEEMKRTREVPPKKPVRRLSKEQLELKVQLAKAASKAKRVVEEIQRENQNFGQRLLSDVGEVASTMPRSVMASMDQAAVMRQGRFYVMAHPLRAFEQLRQSFKAIFSERADIANQENLAERPNAKSGDYTVGDVDITPKEGPLSATEELFQSRLVQYLSENDSLALTPLRLGAKAVIASERGFRTFCNGMRADLFDILKADTVRFRKWFYGADAAVWTPEDAKVIGRVTNILGSRGTGLKGGGTLGWLLWAPRWLWSTMQAEFVVPLQLMTPKWLGQWKGDAATRAAVAKLYVQSVIGRATYGTVMYAIYWLLARDEKHKPQVEWNILSSDWLKIRIGDTRIDASGGLPQMLTLVARQVTGMTKTQSGKLQSIRGEDVGYGKDDSWDILTRFIRQKLGPAPSGLVDLLSGRNAVGQPRSVYQVVGERLRPITWGDIYDAETNLGVAQGTVAAIEAFFGVGVSTYAKKPLKPRKTATVGLRGAGG